MYKHSLVTMIFIFSSSIINAEMTAIPSHLAQFEKTNICIGCDLSEANLIYTHHDNANLSQALLTKANLGSADFHSSNFSNAQIMYANLGWLHASGSNFTSTNLSGSNLSYSNLTSSNFTDAILAGADFSNTNLARAIISKEQLASTRSLSCAILPDGTRHTADSGNSC